MITLQQQPMKNFFRSFLIVLLAFWGSLAKAQCPNDNSIFFTYAAPTTIGASVGSGICIYGGEYYLLTNMVAGNTYRLASCGSSDIVDTRLSVYANASGGSSVAFNDDFCGLRAQLDFTPETTGSYRILLDETGPGATCAGGFSDPDCGEIVVTLISTGPSTAYCVPQYASGTANGDYINGVTLGSISNLNSGSSTGSSYNDLTNLSTGLAAGTEYTLQVQNNPDFSEVVAAWIDYNQDLTFSSDELLGQTSVTAGSTASINLIWALGNDLNLGYHGSRGNGVTGTFALNTDSFAMAGFKLYPNPADDIFAVELPNEFETVEVKLFDVVGKLVFTKQISQLDNKIDINSLVAGNYIIKVTSDEKTFSTNLIIQ
jgi:hypothetical protein